MCGLMMIVSGPQMQRMRNLILGVGCVNGAYLCLNSISTIFFILSHLNLIIFYYPRYLSVVMAISINYSGLLHDR
jgi:hypothetical protein